MLIRNPWLACRSYSKNIDINGFTGPPKNIFHQLTPICRSRPFSTPRQLPPRCNSGSSKQNYNNNHHQWSYRTYLLAGSTLLAGISTISLSDTGFGSNTRGLQLFSRDNPDHDFSKVVFPKDSSILYKSLDEPPEAEDPFLQESPRKKRKKTALHRQSALYKLYSIVLSLKLYTRRTIEAVITCARFLQLSALFVPVLLSLPLVWLGSHVPIQPSSRSDEEGPQDHNNSHTRTERRGAILWYKYFTWTMEAAGPSFIKLGQWAASRTDIFPDALCVELSKLHSQAKAHSLKHTRSIVSRAFGRPFDQIFEEFIETPLGVGAMGQVYHAKLSADLIKEAHDRVELEQGIVRANASEPNFQVFKRVLGLKQQHLNDLHVNNPWVVIKVLHPMVRRVVERDLAIMRFFANLVDCIPTMEWLSLPDEVNQFARMMRSQMDLRIEAENLLTFRANFDSRNDPISFPLPYTEFCTRNVLVEESITAVPMGRLLRSCRDRTAAYSARSYSSNLDDQETVTPLFKDIADKGLDAFLKMLLIDNFLHSDLHPGNIFVRLYRKKKDSLGPARPEFMDDSAYANLEKLSDAEFFKELNRLYDEEGYRPQVCFIDAGLVTRLNDVNRRNFLDLFKAIATFDGYRVGGLMIERSRTPETAIDAEVFALKTQRLVQHIKERTFALGSVKLGDLLGRMLHMVRQHHVRMEGDFITVVLSILLLEGIGRQLDPDIDLFKSSIPILRQLSQTPYNEMTLNSDTMSMFKVWIALEIRQFISASIQDIHRLVKYDGLCPNH